MVKMKPWVFEDPATDEELDIMVSGIAEELGDATPGDHAVYVMSDTLVYGTVEQDGSVHIYQTKIETSNQDLDTIKLQREARNLSGGLLS